MEISKTLLSTISHTINKYENRAKETGENFNIFYILGLTTNEVRTHSAFITELLNPKGSHGQGDIFLQLFIKTLGLNISIEDYSKVKIYKEKYIGIISADWSEGGSIDILIEIGDTAIIIENKIYAGDQEKQLLRYFNYGKKHYKKYQVIYLTLHGHNASLKTIGVKSDAIPHINISYREHIIAWLNMCQIRCNVAWQTALIQYINLIKVLSGRSINENMEKDIVELILSNKDNYKAALTIADNVETAKYEVVKKLFEQLQRFAETNNFLFEQKGIPGQRHYECSFYKINGSLKIVLHFDQDWGFLGVMKIKEDVILSDLIIADLKTKRDLLNLGKKRDFSNWVFVNDYTHWNDTHWADIYDESFVETMKKNIREIFEFIE